MLFLFWLIIRAFAGLLVLQGSGDGAKDLEILVLRQQLRVLLRKTGRPRFTALDRVLLAAASRAVPCHAPDAAALASRAGATKVDLPEQAQARPPADRPRGRCAHPADGEGDPRWGCVRIAGEFRKLGIRVSVTTIRTLLRRHGSGPAPRRYGPTWSQFLRAQAAAIVACDFFTVETIGLQTLYVAGRSGERMFTETAGRSAYGPLTSYGEGGRCGVRVSPSRLTWLLADDLSETGTLTSPLG